jgi:hypothetical protein
MREIVGVVGDIRNRNLNSAPTPAYYLPHTQMPFSQMVVVVKTANDPRSLIYGVTKEVAAIDPDLPLFGVKTMEEYMSASVATPRFNTTLLSIFAAVALVLTIVGLYGVMSYSVAQRTNEIGIRTGRAATQRVVDDRQAGLTVDHARVGHRVVRRIRSNAIDRQLVVWRDCQGSVDVCLGGGGVSARGFPRLLHPSVARYEGRSLTGAEVRIRWTN